VCIFGKVPLTLNLKGVTNNDLDVSVDTLKEVLIPFLSKFGVEDASIKILKRGIHPLGGGEV